MADGGKTDKRNELKSEIAQGKPRDKDGHFVKAEKGAKDEKSQNPVLRFFNHDGADYQSGTGERKDDLIDLRIHNPLKRITELLEDIKRQKAFNFTVKGSLGIMGVFLTLSLFGIFGGGQVLCEKGTQVEIGVIRQLSFLREDPSESIPVLSQIVDYFSPRQKRPLFVLVGADESVLQIPYSRNVDLAGFANYRVIATGSLNACSNTLTITDQSAIEAYIK